MTIPTATKVAVLPHLGLNAYEAHGRAYVSMSEILRATRPTTKDTTKISKWLEGDANTSHANGSQGSSQAFEGDHFWCHVPRPDGSHILAHLFSPQIAWTWILNELSNRSSEVVAKALKLIQLVGAGGFETLCQESLGLRASMSENLTAAVRLQADLSVKAPDMQRLKLAMYQSFMPHREFMTTFDLPRNDLYYPISKQIRKVFNSVYSRLDEGVHSAISTVQKNTPTESYKRATKYSCLTAEAKDALKPVINAYITGFKMLQTPATPLDVDRIIANVDSIYPRYDRN